MRKHSIGVVLVLIVSLILPMFVVPNVTAADEIDEIVLDPGMVTNESGRGDATALVTDEIRTEIRNGKEVDVPVSWDPGAPYPASAYIDLGQRYALQQVSLFDYTGDSPDGLIVEYGSPGDWQVLFVDYLKSYNTWNTHAVEVTTRYIRVTKTNYAPMAQIKLYGTAIPPDVTPPAAIADLTAATEGSAVRLDWTAPGNDGHVGTAKQYMIRYSLETITEDNWDEAIPIPGTPVPAEAGTPQHLIVEGLPEDTEVFFAIMTSDDWEVPNVSELSNIASITTSPDVFPPSAIEDLVTSVIGSSSITLTWTAPGDNGNAGTSSRYELRYSVNAPGGYASLDAWWTDAAEWGPVPDPKAAGETEQFEVTGLLAETDYYLALIAIDKVDLASPLTNVLHVKTKEKDITPPGQITDLQVAIPDPKVSSATFTWTAPGDDGDIGTAVAYELRYSTKPIEDADQWWNTAQTYPGMPAPAEAGTTQSVIINGLDAGIYYYAAIKTADKDGNISELSNEAKFGFVKKIMLDPSMVINESGAGNASALVDEQELAGDPAGGAGGKPVSNWTGIDKWLRPYSAVIDLGHPYDLKELYLYDSTGTGNLRGYVGDPTDWTQIFSDALSNYNAWNRHVLDTESQYIRLEMDDTNNPIELVLYGIGYDVPEEMVEPSTRARPLMKEFIGINGFIDDPIDRLAVAGTVREYHNWRWDEIKPEDYPNNVKAYEPSKSGGGAWNFDTYYANLKEMGVSVFPSIKDSVTAFGDKLSWKPVYSHDDPTDPFSYAMHADHMFQYAARYGSNPVDPSLLKLREDQPVRTGLGLLQYFENENEPNKNWFDRNSYFTPYEYAALASADYDGHMGQMGPTFGVKNADPNAKLVMAGLVGNGVDLQYLQAIKFWADHHRVDEQGEASFPFDVINFHHYSREYDGNDYVGISPEEDGFKERVQALVDWRNRYLPELEVWISEFGYDTHPASPQRASAIGTFSAEDVQAQWLTRSYLALAAAGVDRAQMYMMRDVDPNCASQYCTSGLTSTQATGYVQKPSWYYVYTLKNHLGDMRFVEQIMDPANPGVMNYMFASDSGEKAYVLWSPTSEQKEIRNYPFHVGGSDGDYQTQITLADKSVNGVFSYLPVQDGKVMLNISENPIIIREGMVADTNPPTWGEGSALQLTDQTMTSVKLAWPEAVGEQKVNYYSIYNGTTWLKTVPASVTDYVVQGLKEAEAYDFKVYAGDIKGKESSPLTASMVQADLTPPTAPQEVISLISTSSQVMLSWKASTDNIGVTGYRIYRDQQVLAGTAPGQATIYTVNGLSPSREYTFVVTAVDADGNESEPSNPVTVRTLANSGGSGGYYPAPVVTPSQPGPSGEQSGSSSSSDSSGEIVTVIVDREQLQNLLQESVQQSEDAPVISLTAPANTDGGVFQIAAQQWGQLLRSAPDAVLEFSTGQVSYKLPIDLLDLTEISEQLDTELQDLTIQVEVRPADWETYAQMLQAADRQAMELVSDLYVFEITVQTADGTAQAIDDFGTTYVERTIVLPRYVNQKNLTAVRYNPDTGTMQFIPATIVLTPSGTVVTLKSNGNSLYTVVHLSKTFADIEHSYAKEDIELLASKLIIYGKSASEFDPGGWMKRSEFAALLVRSLGLLETEADSHYTDVSESKWYARAIAAAERAGLTVLDEEAFRPEEAITREEAASMFYHALQRQAYKADTSAGNLVDGFQDGASVSMASRDALHAMIDLGIMQGFPDSTLRPHEQMTREQCAIMLRKLLEQLQFI